MKIISFIVLFLTFTAPFINPALSGSKDFDPVVCNTGGGNALPEEVENQCVDLLNDMAGLLGGSCESLDLCMYRRSGTCDPEPVESNDRGLEGALGAYSDGRGIIVDPIDMIRNRPDDIVNWIMTYDSSKKRCEADQKKEESRDA